MLKFTLTSKLTKERHNQNLKGTLPYHLKKTILKSKFRKNFKVTFKSSFKANIEKRNFEIGYLKMKF